MYDFTWRSYFKVCAVLAVPAVILALSGTHEFSVESMVGYLIALPMLFAVVMLLYGAIAPILAYTVNSYRETGSALQTGKRLLGLGVAMLLMAGVLVLVGVGGDAVKAWLADKPWGWIVSGLCGLLVMFGYALNFYDAYRARKQINSLNTYTPSDSTSVTER